MSGITLYFWSNGQTMAFDENGEQMPDIQRQSWQELYLQWLELQGYSRNDIGCYLAGNWNLRPKPTVEGEGGWIE